MKTQRHFNIAAAVIMTAGILLSGAQGAFADDWGRTISGNLSLIYGPSVNLKRVERLLKRRYFATDLRSAYENPSSGADQRIAVRLQAIFSRVEQLLGMYPVIPELSVKIYKDRRELGVEYLRIFKSAGQFKSFYVHKLKTVFVSEQDITDSVIAHEFAHAVADHYFSALPPAQVAELISIYVDTHLEE
jgi:hypothetical protein